MEIPRSRVQIRAMRTAIVAVGMFLAASVLSSGQTLTVWLYDYSGLTAGEIESMTKFAGLALGHAGIGVSWIYCFGAPAKLASNTCAKGAVGEQIVVRLHPRPPRESDARTERMGAAFVTRQGGHYSTVYVSAVDAFAAEMGIAPDLAVGYAMAHEIGHCMLGPGHSVAGLMRATWTYRDAQEMKRLSLGLSKPEASRARARLAGR